MLFAILRVGRPAGGSISASRARLGDRPDGAGQQPAGHAAAPPRLAVVTLLRPFGLRLVGNTELIAVHHRRRVSDLAALPALPLGLQRGPGPRNARPAIATAQEHVDRHAATEGVVNAHQANLGRRVEVLDLKRRVGDAVGAAEVGITDESTPAELPRVARRRR